jgi:hypothetical protein
MPVIAGIDISRPWKETGLTSQTWLEQPIQYFMIRDLILTQNGVLFEDVFKPGEPFGGDIYPHVVIYDHKCYLEDGHHRVIQSLIKAQPSMLARYVELEA